MLSACDMHSWKPVAVSSQIGDLATLVAIGTVEIVVTIDWRQSLADAVQSAGGKLAVIRQSTTPRIANLGDALSALVASGRLSHSEATSLLSSAGTPMPGCPPDPNQRPQRVT